MFEPKEGDVCRLVTKDKYGLPEGTLIKIDAVYGYDHEEYPQEYDGHTLTPPHGHQDVQHIDGSWAELGPL